MDPNGPAGAPTGSNSTCSVPISRTTLQRIGPIIDS